MSHAAAILTTTNLYTDIPKLSAIDNILQFGHELLDEHRIKILSVAGALSLGWIFNKVWVNRRLFDSTQSMKGKTVLITGGNAGIGYETAKDLLRRGARVIIACRNMEKGQQAVEQLYTEAKCSRDLIRLMQIDLASLESVREFVRTYNDEEERLDVLICNAGLIWSPEVITKDGFNTVIQSNYLGHFLLTNLLIDKLRASRPSRIINVSSAAHKNVRSFDWSDAFTQLKCQNFFKWYGISKAFQIMSTYKLQQDYSVDGVHSFSVHPGWVWTGIQQPLRHAMWYPLFVLLGLLARVMKIVFAKTPETGALTIIYCAVEPTLDSSSGVYFEDCQTKLPASICARDDNINLLWKLSCDAVGSK